MINTFKTIIMMSGIGSIIIILSLILMPITKKYFSASWHYISKRIALLFFVLPIPLLFSNVPNSVSHPLINTISSPNTFNHDVSNGNSNILLDTVIDTEMITPKPKYPVRTIPLYTLNILIAIWIGGIVVASLWYRYCYKRFIGDMKNHSVDISSCSEIANLLITCKKHLNLNKNFKVYIKKDLSSPAVIGFLKNTLLIPENLLFDEDLKPILLHELTHIKRKDLSIKLLMILASILHWFNPFIYLLKKELNIWCELSCDELITIEMAYNERKEYGQSILKVVENLAEKSDNNYSTTFITDKNNIKRRLLMILKSKKPKKLTTLIAGIVITFVLLISISVITFASNKTDRIVKFIDIPQSEYIDPPLVANSNNPATERTNEISEEKISESTNPEDNSIAVISEPTNVTNNAPISANPLHYVNKNLGISLDFPPSWQDKYKIVEKNNCISVYLADQYLSDDTGWFFIIGLDIDPLSLDTIYEIPKIQQINGKTFSIGGPTGMTIKENSPYLNLFRNMTKDLGPILKTLKGI